MMVEGFNRHYRLFRKSSVAAKERFERADWCGVQQAVRDWIQFYDDRVVETSSHLWEVFGPKPIDDGTWQLAKLFYIGLLVDHKQPELAETFFNLVFCRIMHRTYFHNDFIFVRSAISTGYIDSSPPAYRSYYPSEQGLRATMIKIFRDFGWGGRSTIWSGTWNMPGRPSWSIWEENGRARR